MAISIQAGTNMAMVLANTGGGVQALPNQMVGAKPHVWTERITFAAQASGVNIPIARIPYGSIMLGIVINTTITLGATATIAFGDMNNTARFAAAANFTAVDTPTQKLNATSMGAALTTCYDTAGVSNQAYEDVIMTVAAAALPASGTFVVSVLYQDPGV